MKQIPAFALYGETRQPPDLLHIERIEDRAAALDWRIKTHRHPGLDQMLLIRSGGGELVADGWKTRFEGQTALFVPQMCVHGFTFDPGTDGVVLTAHSSTIAAALGEGSEVLDRLKAPMVETADVQVSFAMQELAAEYASVAQDRAAMLRGWLNIAARWFARRASDAPNETGGTRSQQIYADFQTLLEAHFTTDKSVVFYANKLGRTAPHLNRVCKELTQTSASTLILRRVVLEAQRELAYTSQTIAEIGYALGYPDPAYFSRAFRRGAGCSPKEYRAGLQ
ncbi:MAG: helix-turn-helix domain-containing protein [Pikeienuella sp.]